MTQTSPPYVWPNIAALRATDDPHDDQKPCLSHDEYRIKQAALGRAKRLRALAESVRAVAGLLTSIGPAAVLTMAADELAQLAGGPIEAKE